MHHGAVVVAWSATDPGHGALPARFWSWNAVGLGMAH